MKKNRFSRLISSALAIVTCVSFGMSANACKPKTKKDAIVLMSEELSGLFNPFYATAGADHNVIGLTQIGMLSTEYVKDSNYGPYGTAQMVAGDDYACVVKAYSVDTSDPNETVYTFVLKNGLKFSDGKPLTMNDVMFNIYEYLDPVYTGSSTMYSIKIKGLSKYRTQSDTEGDESELNNTAAGLAFERRQELIDVYTDDHFNKSDTGGTYSYEATREDIVKFINSSDYEPSPGYTGAFQDKADIDYKKQLIKDYDYVCETFKKEIESDFRATKEAYDLTKSPYKEHPEFKNDIFKFFFYLGYIKPVYKDDHGREDLTNIVKFEEGYKSYLERYNTEEKAINFVVKDKLTYNLNEVLTAWSTAGTVLTKYTGDARSYIMQDREKIYNNIEGVVSLGHTGNTDKVKAESWSKGADGKIVKTSEEYKVATSHNADGTPANPNEYDVLRITVDGVDPKAIYNFGFTVAPAHYYTASSEKPYGEEIDIANNKFGVRYADAEFQGNVIQSQKHVEVPVGAGPYVATDSSNKDNPSGSEFVKANTVFYKANKHFMFPVKAEKVQLLVVSSANAIDKLEKGEVDYVTPQLTTDNSERLDAMESKGFKNLSTMQLGYGYIGINAGKVPDVNARRAIMAAMQTSLAKGYYKTNTCKNIDWPMSMVNWAYPYDSNNNSLPNGHDYLQWLGDADAKNKIKSYTEAITNSEINPETFQLKLTIAGASITEHPTYQVFKHAQELLKECGWKKVEIVADSQALTKLATGSLQVWAAAWGSTIDPDMYQVYHKDSTATSVYAWGYREIKTGSDDIYGYEKSIIMGDGVKDESDGKNYNLSEYIDLARETLDMNRRKELYKKAMDLVLRLAIEMPVYQRDNLYAYNSNTVKGFVESNADLNPYTSPIDKIWELELVK